MPVPRHIERLRHIEVLTVQKHFQASIFAHHLDELMPGIPIK